MKTKKTKLFWGLLLVLAWLVMPASALAISLVEAEWLQENLGAKNLRIVDVSNKPDTYAKGHIPGAVPVKRYLDLSGYNPATPGLNLYPSQAEFEQLMGRLGITPATTVVAYDDSPGFFAARLLVIMELYGHDTSKLKLLNGGSKYWAQAGFPMVTESPQPQKTAYRAKKNYFGERTVTWSQVYTDVVRGGKPELVLVDVRPGAEYQAENIRAIRGGHIPKAINVTGGNAVGPDMRFKPLEEIRQMFVEAGVTPDKEIYEYCHSGDRSAHAYFILHHLLGYQSVKSYYGSWTEWARNTALPAEGQVWLWEARK
ncbi:sulfurtransferase [Desulfurivibrio sp. D14AmB]|uniref:sulfurtransferase n=1 Tax=Desulfurivibrio sp. D14AmB TaxID=3374370 RepID=UPI00376EC568